MLPRYFWIYTPLGFICDICLSYYFSVNSKIVISFLQLIGELKDSEFDFPVNFQNLFQVSFLFPRSSTVFGVLFVFGVSFVFGVLFVFGVSFVFCISFVL